MIKFNVLTESFVSNSTISNQFTVNSEEFTNLIVGSGNAFTFSGQSISLLIDLGAQKSIDNLYYTFSPTSFSGVSIYYGRDLNNLFLGSPTIVTSGLQVTPTQSGYTYPRYFRIDHVASSGSSAITTNSLAIFNNEDDIQFGPDGLSDSITVTSSGFDGLSAVYEIQVLNSGTIPTDIFVSFDTSDTDLDILNRIEIAPTATGTFQQYNEALDLPNAVPWQWGILDNTTISNDNKIKLVGDTSIDASNFLVGQTYTLLNGQTVALQTFPQPVTRPDFAEAVYYTNTAGQIIFVDLVKNTQLISASPAVVPTNDNQRAYYNPGWDGEDRLYYMNNSNDQTVRYYKMSTNTHHVLGTVTFYTRRYRSFTVVGNDLYVSGGSSVSGTETTNATDLYRVDLTSLTSTLVTSLPVAFSDSTYPIIHLDNYLYIIINSNTPTLARWNINLAIWEILSLPGSGSVNTIGLQPRNNSIWIVRNFLLYELNVSSLQYTSLGSTNFSPATLIIGTVALQGSALYAKRSAGVATDNNFRPYYTIADPPIAITASGTYTTPVFKLDNTTNYHKVLLDYIRNSSARIQYDNSISYDNFQIRGSNLPPAADNITQEFSEALDPLEFVTGTLNQNSLIVSSGNELTFSHNFVDVTETEYNSAYITYGFPLNTTGKMQYKFWWNPSSNKVVNNTHYSAFYIVPFLDTLDTGDLPERDQVTLRRTQDNFISIRFGQNSDSAGLFTLLQFYNGSTTATYPISARTGTKYEVGLNIDWDARTYSLYFAGTLLGSGIIPALRVSLIGTQHSYEIFSASQNIDAEEEFAYITINRVGTLPIEDTNIAIPVHREDPNFGTNSSNQWFPVTVNSALIPKYDYVQLKLTLRAQIAYTGPTVSEIKFPVVIILKDVPVGGTKSVFVRYNFPPSNNLSTNLIKLKAWMSTDKL